MKKTTLLLATVCALSSFAASAHREINPSAGSVQGSAALSAAVVLVPLSLVVVGSEAVATGLNDLSKTLSAQTQWTLRGMTVQGDRTVLALQSLDQKATLTVSIPTSQAERAQLRLNQTVTAERLGDHSFALKVPGTTLGVLAEPAAGLSRSREKR